MRSRRTRPLALEQLENRWCPALSIVALDAAGNLLIQGTPSSDTLTLNVTGTDEIEVLDGVDSLGTFSAVGNVRVILGNKVINNAGSGLLVDFDLNGNSLSGNVAMTLGNVINVGGGGSGYVVDDGDVGGSIDGSLSITSGSGDDSVLLDGGTTIGGNLSFSAGAGLDTLYLGDPFGLGAAATIEGNVSATKVNDFALSDLPTPSTIAGHLTINSAGENQNNDIRLLGTVAGGSAVEGNVVITTGNGFSDMILLQGSIGGHLIVNAGQGSNALILDPSAFVLGNMTYTGGSNGDVVNLASTAGGGAVVMGGITVVAGNGINQFLIDTDTFVGGRYINYIGGNQVDLLTFNGLAAGARLNAQLRAGNDQFTFGSNALAFAYVDFGAGFDMLTLTAPVTSFNLPLIFRNLP